MLLAGLRFSLPDSSWDGFAQAEPGWSAQQAALSLSYTYLHKRVGAHRFVPQEGVMCSGVHSVDRTGTVCSVCAYKLDGLGVGISYNS